MEMLISKPELIARLGQGIKPVKDITRQVNEIEEIYAETLLPVRTKVS